MALWCVSQNRQHLLCTSCLQSAYTQNKYQRWHSGKNLRFELPETGASSWRSGVLVQDNNIYYMPYHAHQIMRLNPDNDSLSSVGDDLRRGVFGKYRGTVVGNDDACMASHMMPNALSSLTQPILTQHLLQGRKLMVIFKIVIFNNVTYFLNILS